MILSKPEGGFVLRLRQAVGGSHIDMWKEMCDFVVD